MKNRSIKHYWKLLINPLLFQSRLCSLLGRQEFTIVHQENKEIIGILKYVHQSDRQIFSSFTKFQRIYSDEANSVSLNLLFTRIPKSNMLSRLLKSHHWQLMSYTSRDKRYKFFLFASILIFYICMMYLKMSKKFSW